MGCRWQVKEVLGRGGRKKEILRYIRDRSCLLRCSLLLNALLQNWHLYFRSGCATADFREAGAGVGAAVGRTATFAPGILIYGCRVVGDSTGKKDFRINGD